MARWHISQPTVCRFLEFGLLRFAHDQHDQRAIPPRQNIFVRRRFCPHIRHFLTAVTSFDQVRGVLAIGRVVVCHHVLRCQREFFLSRKFSSSIIPGDFMARTLSKASLNARMLFRSHP